MAAVGKWLLPRCAHVQRHICGARLVVVASPPPPDDLRRAHGDDMESYFTILYALWRPNPKIAIIQDAQPSHKSTVLMPSNSLHSCTCIDDINCAFPL